jgi:microcin C transport system permease protein
LQLNPLTIKRLRRFRAIRRGYVSFLILLGLIVASAFAELWINSRALVVKYQGHYFLPTYGAMHPGTDFGFDYAWETNYRDLAKALQDAGSGDFVIMPIVPYNPLENDLRDDGTYPPFAPSFETRHYLGTDKSGRDVMARLVYGFRIAMGFALLLLLFDYSIGISVGCIMGFIGGRFDLLLQRVIEVWSNIPFLYVVIIISSITTPSFFKLILIMAAFGWVSMTWYMRTATYKEKAREYALAARAIGCSTPRIIFRHIIPNTISVFVTFVPFSVAGGISSLTALDFLGFGLPPPTPSWGELLNQGLERLDAHWIVSSVVVATISVLVMVTFLGEAIREAFDPKLHTTYE